MRCNRRHVLVFCAAFLGMASSSGRPDAYATQVSANYSARVQADVAEEVESCNELDLYCLPLHPTARAATSSGEVRLLRPPSVFGVTVSREGHQRYIPEMSVRGLPDPSVLGPYTTFVAWAVSPNLSQEQNLGVVQNGRVLLGEVSLNKFLIFVSAESSNSGPSRQGPLVLRGQSPSSRMQSHASMQVASINMAVGDGGVSEMVDNQEGDMAAHDHGAAPANERTQWPRPPMHPAVSMMPGMGTISPTADPWTLAGTLEDGSATRWNEATESKHVYLADGDTLVMRAGIAKKKLGDRWHLMYAYNDQIPGPILHVQRSTMVTVIFQNETAFPSSIHWHGLRQDNKDDGVPGLTQEAVQPGSSFTYSVRFPDAGLYWYHPHHREEVQQELGLAGNMLVGETGSDQEKATDHAEILMLDDILIDADDLVPFGKQETNYASMGRFGNILLVNGDTHYDKTVSVGESVRFFVTNVSNTRTFNLSLDGHALKMVATDVSLFERQAWEDALAIAPAERYIADVQFTTTGRYALVNHVQGIDHQLGRFFPERDTLGYITVIESASEDGSADESFTQLYENGDVIQEIDSYRDQFDRPVDRDIDLVLETDQLPPLIEQVMRLDRLYFNPVEWTGTMAAMNWATTASEIKWILRDVSSGLENTQISWRSKINTVEKIRLNNRTDALHAMQHPIHLHGQRFIVLSYNGQPTSNRAWKDTVLIPTGMSAEILVEYTNPGKWMMHCHIAEHLETGMKLVFEVYK